MSAAIAPDNAAASPYVSLSADDARREVLIALCRRYKGIDPTIDARIDAAAPLIYGVPGAKVVPAERPGANKVPLYFEGEPGVGKTSLVRGAIKEFCAYAGLNFIENPPDDFVPGPNDFYYCTVNLSGKQNVSDFGGMPFRTEAQISEHLRARKKASGVGSLVADSAVSQAKALAAYEGLRLGEVKSYDDGPLSVTELTLAGDPAKAYKAVEVIMRTVGEDAKRAGVGVGLLADGDVPADDRVSYQITRGTGGVRLYLNAPRAMEERAEYVTAALPNLRFHMAKHVRFALFNFDDVANASEPVRNVLLEVAQSGRYSGTMDIGNSMVTFTGNMGSEDNTNVMSKQSDAEVTRIRKFRIFDSPADFAKRITEKYASSDVGDCHFASFIARQGQQEGIFREPPGSARGKRGVPKTNSRALENALNVVDGYFMMAKESGLSVSSFIDRIQADVAATAGRRVAIAYQEHLAAMLSEAIPLAEHCMSSGKMDEKRFDKNAGSFIKSSEKDFGFRFAYALADEASGRIRLLVEDAKSSGKEPAKADLKSTFTNMCSGLAALPSDMMNASLARFAARINPLPELSVSFGNGRVLNAKVTTAFGEALGDSCAAGVWLDPEVVQQEVSKVLLGANHGAAAGTKPAASGKKKSP